MRVSNASRHTTPIFQGTLTSIFSDIAYPLTHARQVSVFPCHGKLCSFVSSFLGLALTPCLRLWPRRCWHLCCTTENTLACIFEKKPTNLTEKTSHLNRLAHTRYFIGGKRPKALPCFMAVKPTKSRDNRHRKDFHNVALKYQEHRCKKVHQFGVRNFFMGRYSSYIPCMTFSTFVISKS